MTPPVGAARAGIYGGVGEIPDSAVRQWPFPERTNSTIVENLANDDGTVSGSPTNTADSSFYDGYYEALDGSDDAILLPVGEFETQLQSENWGFALTVRGASGFLDGSKNLFGAADSGFNDFVQIDEADEDGIPRISISDGSGNAVVEASTAIDDSSIYRLFYRVPDNDPNNWEIYVNDSQDNETVTNDQGYDGSAIALSDAVNDVALGARNAGGTIERNIAADVDHPILYDSPDRETVSDDYQLQPFA